MNCTRVANGVGGGGGGGKGKIKPFAAVNWGEPHIHHSPLNV